MPSISDAISQLERFSSQQNISTVINRLYQLEIEGDAADEIIASLRHDLIAVVSNPQSQELKDAAYNALLALAEAYPKNDVDLITLEPIPLANRVVMSTGFQFDIVQLFIFHENRESRNTPQVSDMGPEGKQLINIFTNLPFSPDDAAHIRAVAATHPEVIEIKRLAAEERLAAAERRPAFQQQQRVVTYLREAGIVDERDVNAVLASERLRVVVAVLYDAGILNQENFDAIRNSGRLQHAVALLCDAGILNQENFDAIKNNFDPVSLALMRGYLHNANILTQENFDAVQSVHWTKLPFLTHTLRRLHNANILTQENFNAAINHRTIALLLDALNILQEAGILTQEAFDAVKRHAGDLLGDVARARVSLYNANILTQENFDAVTTSNLLPRATHMLCIAGILNQTNFDVMRASEHLQNIVRHLLNVFTPGSNVHMLNQANFDTVKSHADLESLEYSLRILNRKNLLTHENCNAVKSYVNSKDLASTLGVLARENILTQENFNTVCISKPLQSVVASLNDADILNQNNFHLARACENPESLANALHGLQKSGILTKESFDAVRISQPLQSMVASLDDAGILNKANLDIAVSHPGQVQTFITAGELKKCLDGYKTSRVGFFGKAGPELAKLQSLCSGDNVKDNEKRISFLQIYNCIRNSGGKTSEQRADIFLNDGATDGTGVTNVIKAIREKLTSPPLQPAQPAAHSPRNNG